MADDAFPLTRDTWTFDALWGHCWAAFKREWVTLSVAVLVLFGASMAVSLLTQTLSLPFQGEGGQVALVLVVIFGQLVGIVVQGIFTMGVMRIGLDVLQGRKADLARIFSQASKLGRYLVQQLLVIAVVLVGLAAAFAAVGGVALAAGAVTVEGLRSDPQVAVPFAVMAMLLVLWPALYYGLPIYFATVELVHDDTAGPVEAIRAAYVIARGKRLVILGVMLLAGLVAIAGVIACFIGVIPAIAFGQLLIVGLYLTLRAGSALPPVPPTP